MIYGYARVSTDGQSVAAQVAALTAAGAGKVFQEVASGAKTDRAFWIRVTAPLFPVPSCRRRGCPFITLPYGLSVTCVPKVPIWKALDVNGLPQAHWCNQLIPWKIQLFHLIVRPRGGPSVAENSAP
jgi:hypothetical protein